MKNVILGFFFLGILSSCEVEGPLTRNSLRNEMLTEISTLEYFGNFKPTSGIVVDGSVKIYLDGNQYKVKLENFSITEGPDLKVYLSKSATPNEFVNLGNLSAASIYAIPTTVIVSDYSFVLIYCQQYNHLFAFAPLTKN